MGFTKLDEGILLSSIMQESPEVFKVWIALLAACKEDGVARVSPSGIAAVCFLPIDGVRSIFEKLSSPDQDSRSVNDDGRRIRRVDGGWEIINYQKYRELSTKEKEARRKWESRRKCPDMSGQIRTTPDCSASASLLICSSSSSSLQEDSDRWEEFKKAYPPNGSCVNPEAQEVFRSLAVSDDIARRIIASASDYAAYWRWRLKGKYPHGAYVAQAFNWLYKGQYEIDWAGKLKAEVSETSMRASNGRVMMEYEKEAASKYDNLAN